VKDGRACPACDSPDYRVLFQATDRLYHATDGTFQLIECSRCRLVRLNPRPTPDELRGYYPERYWSACAGRLEETCCRFLAWDQVDFVLRALRDAGASGPVVDMGHGGALRQRLAEEGVRVIGAEELGDGPGPEGGYAAITMFRQLERVEDPIACLVAARELLAPNGRLIVQVHNAACWQLLLLGENWIGFDVPRHLLSYRAEDVERLLAASGFEVVRRRFFSLRDNPSGFATSIAPGLDPAVREVRGAVESRGMRLAKHVLYFALVMGAVPLTVLEAACRAGSSFLVEARKKRV
jgi:hypothetical protein